MKRIKSILPLLCLLAAPAFAAPAYPLEGLLLRAKFVCVSTVKTFDGTNVVLAVQTNLRGDPGRNTLRFKVDVEGGLPERGHLYFVFSQGDDHWGEPKNEIKLSQGLDGQGSYCGWIMLPIKATNDVATVQNAYSFKFRTPEKGIGPLTFDQAKELVQRTPFRTDKNSEPGVGR